MCGQGIAQKPLWLDRSERENGSRSGQTSGEVGNAHGPYSPFVRTLERLWEATKVFNNRMRCMSKRLTLCAVWRTDILLCREARMEAG